jgi:hypothetical protein
VTTTYTRDTRFGYITRLTKHGTTYAACGGLYNRVLIAQRASGGGVDFLGESAELSAEPLDIASDGTPSAYYVLTDFGVSVLTATATPAISAEYLFASGGHRWTFYSAGTLVAPLARGGVRLMSTAGVVLAELHGIVAESTAAAFAGGKLYIFDGVRGKLATVTVTATSLVWEGTVNAPNCREVLRAVVDGTRLYCLCRHRVVRFSLADASAPTSAEDYGLQPVTYTDIAVIGADQIWLGVASSVPAYTGPQFFGPLYGAWDATNAEMNAAAPMMSAWTVSNVIPYYTEETIEDSGEVIPPPPTPPPTPPPVVAPAPPVITSSLTGSVTEDVFWAYTITATGAGPIFYDVVSAPSWLTGINHLTGAISGTPTEPGTYNINITASNDGGTDTESVVLTVVNAIGDNSLVKANGVVEDIHVVGALAYVVGAFTTVTDASGTYTRNYAACLNMSTGLWTAWNPNIAVSVPVCVLASGSSVYIGTTAAGSTFGGVVRGYGGRVDATTGALDATWTPTFDGSVFCFVDSGSRMFVGGAFLNVSGSPREGVCSFTGSSLDSWRPETTDSPVNRLTNHTISELTSPQVRTMKLSGSHIIIVSGSIASPRDAGGQWCRGNASVHATTGIIAQSSQGVGGNLQSVKNNCMVASGEVVYTYGVDFGGTPVTNLPAGADSGEDFYSAVITDSSGNWTPLSRFSVAVSPAYSSIMELPSGSYLSVGTFSSSFGGATYRHAVIHSAAGTVDTGFTYYDRMNAAAQGSPGSLYGVRQASSSVVLLFGSLGINHNAGALYDGVGFNGLILVNSATGARV